MDSAGNPNQQQPGFDINKLFKPSSNLPPNSQNPTTLSTNYGPPTGSYPYPPQSPAYYQPHMPPIAQDQNSQNPNAGASARLMAMLSNPRPNLESSSQPTSPSPSIQPPINGGPMRMPSSKLPRGRHLVGDRVVYDVDARLPGEEQPQLEVTPITKYVSDPGLVLGRQIAVNKNYICYGLKMGNIRVLNINTALRALLRGHTQRITDMAFFAEDVPFLASASIDGRVYVWKISEGPDEDEKPQISGNVMLAIQITGVEGSIRPRICWHSHKQEILVIAIGKSVLRIDATKVGKGVDFVAENPLQCPIDKLMEGIELIGQHEGEVTDLSMCQWMTTRLVSASKDGTIKIWEDRKSVPLLLLRPHDGHPVDAAKFLVVPHRPDHIMLVTAGPLNREVKLWSSSDEEGWLLPSDAESWHCIQTLELKSSAEPRNEEAFFNQLVTLSQAGLLLLANAKKNAIYVVHVDYGPNPASTCMDYLAEFTVTMPILSFTGTSEILPHGQHLVQVYCVQTQAIQQYALDLSQCLPPPMEKTGLEKSESVVSRDASEGKSFEGSVSVPGLNSQAGVLEYSYEIKHPVSSASNMTITQQIPSSNMVSSFTPVPSDSGSADVVSVASPPLPLSPRLFKKFSDLRGDKGVTDYTVDRQIDSAHTNSAYLHPKNDDNTLPQKIVSDVSEPAMFKHPTHLVTPLEIMATSSADGTHTIERGEIGTKVQCVISDMKSTELEVEVVGEVGFADDVEATHQIEPEVVPERKEKSFFSQASGLGADMTREYRALPSDTHIMEEARKNIMDAIAQPSNSVGEEVEANEDISEKATDFTVSARVPPSPATSGKGRKQKGKNVQSSGSSLTSQNVSDTMESVQGSVACSSLPSMETAFPQILTMQEKINEILIIQKEMQKEMPMMVAVPVTKEGRRIEAALGRSMDKFAKANADALWARIQEDNAKHEKLLRERTQQIIGLMNNLINKELLALVERTIKKELVAVGTNVARTLSPAIEKSITESILKGVGDKAASQLEKSVTSKLDANVARQIQAQFQTSGKQALQDGLKSCLETSIIPALNMSCKAMFEQVDAGFQKGMAEHMAAAQHHIGPTHSQLGVALRDALNSASSVTQTLSRELSEGQQKLLALLSGGPTLNTGNTLVSQLSNGPLPGLHDKVEQLFDPTRELSRLISEHKYEEAFTAALQRSDVSILSWLCSQVNLQQILSRIPLPLSQGVLLSLLQQLACDLTKDAAKKLAWMTEVATCINPHDPSIAPHVRSILEQVYQILGHQRSLATTTPAELSNVRVVMHVINSMLMSCK